MLVSICRPSPYMKIHCTGKCSPSEIAPFVILSYCIKYALGGINLPITILGISLDMTRKINTAS